MNSKHILMTSLCIVSLACACSDGGKDKDETPAISLENTAALCSDNLDNDNNGFKDCEDQNCQAFVFCNQTEEGKENTLAACQDGIDNDGDTLKDCDDSECSAFTICGQTPPTPETPIVENTVQLCSDNVDNDNNGTKDCDDANCKAFSMCEQAEEGKENTLAACMDHEDNDGDGKTDCDDEECQDFAICQKNTAENTLAACQDGSDNDGDGKIDCADEECKSFNVCNTGDPDLSQTGEESTVAACYFDEVDNDGDTLIDCDDPNCKIYTFCQNLDVKYENTLETCQDGLDNDEDGKADCLDPECLAFIVCQPEAESPKENTAELCSDGKDNDEDGNLDCIDPDCWAFDVCADLVGVAENTRELCTDGKDNDFNGKTDKDDDNCKLFYAGGGQYGENTVTLCKDSKDNDGDGVKDCDDPECQVYDFCQAGYNEADDECKDDPFTSKKQGKCKCGETLVGEDCYTNIASPADFDKMANSTGKFIIKQDIDFGTTTRAPVTTFKGTLDGNNKRISGVFNQKSGTENGNTSYDAARTKGCSCGLFGFTESAREFRNIDLAITLNCDCSKTASSNLDVFVGALTSYMKGTVKNITGSSKVYVEETSSLDVTPQTSLNKEVGGLFGHVVDTTISDIEITGNVSANFSNTRVSTSSANAYYLKVGGIAGYIFSSSDKNSLSNIHANNFVTLKRNHLYNNTYNYAYSYLGGIAGYCNIPKVTDVHNQGVVSLTLKNTHTSDKDYSWRSSTIGGLFGTASGKVSDSSFNGRIIMDGYRPDTVAQDTDPGAKVGGIIGKLMDTKDGSAIDHCDVDAELNVVAQNSRIGGIVGQMICSSGNSFVQNSTSNIDVYFIDVKDASSSVSGYYGGIAGHAGWNHYISTTACHIINNSAQTKYHATEKSITTLTKNFAGIAGYGGVIVNNFAFDKLVPHEPYTLDYTPKAIGGAYVYESYWNKDTMGNVSGATEYADASAEPYTFNPEGIPVTRAAKTVLGLLRYNSGHDGGVLSAHIPANTDGIYYNWTTITDDDGHVIPVPADK